MKRYGITIVFVLLIFISIGAFYTQATTSHYPSFELIKQYGDESEIKGVSLMGSYMNNNNYRINPNITIDSAGSKYKNRSSLLFTSPNYSDSKEIKQLVSDHRQFMRGKHNVNSLYEDDDLLVYADVIREEPNSRGVRQFYFEVSVLAKKQDKSWSYEVNVPNQKSEYMINVDDVQVVGDEIIVVTSNYLSVGSEFHRYTLGLKSKQAPVDQIIELPQSVVIESSGMQVNSTNVQKFNEAYITHPNKYLVFYVTRTQTAKEGTISNNDPQLGATVQMDRKLIAQAGAEQIIAAEIIVYDLQTGFEVQIDSQPLIDFMLTPSDSSFMNLSMEGNRLFITKQSNQGVQVMENLLSSEVATIHDIHFALDPAEHIYFTVIKNDRLYALTENLNNRIGPSFILVDLKSDEIIYRGTIEHSDTERDQANEMSQLRLYNIEIE